MQLFGCLDDPAPQGMADLISHLISALFELLFAATGRKLLALVGWRQPHEIVCLFTGMAFWIVVGVFGYALMRR
jgi:hypothetical protein